MMLYSPKPNEKLLKIKIVDITGKEHLVDLSPRLTGYQLKDYLFGTLCKELKPKDMRITYQGAELANGTKISQFNVAVGNMLVFRQEKIALNMVSHIMVHNVEDEVFFEQYQYQWPCGHYIGQAGIVAHMKAVIANGQYPIKCPFLLENGTKCNFEWDYSVCKKIGVLTAQEKMDFEVALSQNYMKQHQKLCPKCNQRILKEADNNRVRCPYPTCKYGDFCFRCMGPWSNNQSNGFCGSQTCRFAYQYLASAAWDRVFDVKDTKNGNKVISVKTPHYRACPKCHMVCENYTACKHTTCTCKTKFCWICLGVYNNSWPCGSYGEYCGTVAQLQTFAVKQ